MWAFVFTRANAWTRSQNRNLTLSCAIVAKIKIIITHLKTIPKAIAQLQIDSIDSVLIY